MLLEDRIFLLFSSSLAVLFSDESFSVGHFVLIENFSLLLGVCFFSSSDEMPHVGRVLVPRGPPSRVRRRRPRRRRPKAVLLVLRRRRRRGHVETVVLCVVISPPSPLLVLVGWRRGARGREAHAVVVAQVEAIGVCAGVNRVGVERGNVDVVPAGTVHAYTGAEI